MTIGEDAGGINETAATPIADDPPGEVDQFGRG